MSFKEFDRSSRPRVANEDLEQAKFLKTDDEKIAVRVGNEETTPLYVEVVNDDSMICEKGVFNLVANVPFEILANNLEEICDATFRQDNGDLIFIAYRNLVDRIEVCSKKTLINLEYRLEGPRKCPS